MEKAAISNLARIAGSRICVSWRGSGELDEACGVLPSCSWFGAAKRGRPFMLQVRYKPWRPYRKRRGLPEY